MQTAEQLKNIVKEKYGTIAKRAATSCCSSSCGCSSEPATAFGEDYSQIAGHYAGADLNLGCGVPTQFANIAAGNVVLDLGSGAGNDVFIARSVVGEQGKVIGVDMTEAMIERARQNQAKLGYQNVEFRLGDIENLPVSNNEVDVVISNCVLNLVPDKTKAFAEIYRVLKPGGHFCVSDIVLQGELPEKVKNMAEMYAGCVAGATQRSEYLGIIQATGFVNLDLKKERQINVEDGVLARFMSRDELDAYRKSGAGILSITVSASKPAVN